MQSATFIPNHAVLRAFIKWIEQPCFHPQHATNWGRLYCADPEAAMCEATTWAMLTAYGVDMAPNADLTGRTKRPDFICTASGAKFYVEATCIQRDSATKETNLTHMPSDSGGATNYKHLNDTIFGECVNKTKQCSNLDAPCVLVVGTFHHQASVLAVRRHFIESLLTGEPYISWRIDQNASPIGDIFESTTFHSSVFTRLSRATGVESARQPISALLVCGYGCSPLVILGVLNPTALRPFDPGLLPRIPFCRQRLDLNASRVWTEWNDQADTAKNTGRDHLQSE